MKFVLVVVAGAIMLAAVPNVQAQGRGGAPACTTVACDVLGDWGRTYALLIGEADE